MLGIKTPDQLATLLGIKRSHLLWLLDKVDDHVDVFAISSPSNPGKALRYVTSAKGPLRNAQRGFYENVLLPRLSRSLHSFGGVPGKSARSNARAHEGQKFLFTTDISQFFPSIHHERVRNLFLKEGCSAKAAGLCTRLVTHDAKLAQGFCTSPILADQMLAEVDASIAKGCRELDLVYTRFVDDIAISGKFDFSNSGIPEMIRRIVRCQGFRVNKGKEQNETSLADGKATVTNIRVFDGRLDVTTAYYSEVVRQLEDHATLGAGTSFQGPFFTQDQLWGRIEYVCSLNPNRRPFLFGLLKKINWHIANDNARIMNLIARAPVKVKVAPKAKGKKAVARAS